MVINVSGGNKAKKQKRTIRYEPTDKLTDGQLFGIILDKCGGCHFRLMCSDGRIRNGKLSGRMANGPRINTGSYVIISLRDFEKDQKNCDIIGHASPSADIIRILKSSNNNNKQKDDITFKDSDDEFEDFNNDGGKKEEEDGDENNKEEDGEKGNRKEEEGDITFQDSDEDEEEEGEEEKEERASKNKGGIDNDVWEDKEENIKKNIITKDELDDLIDLL
jgi:initiation factor 1A